MQKGREILAPLPDGQSAPLFAFKGWHYSGFIAWSVPTSTERPGPMDEVI